VGIYRCNRCARGVHSDSNMMQSCPSCGSSRWTKATRLRWYESIKIWRETDVWFVEPDSIFAKMLLFIDKITPGKTKWL